MPSAKKMSEKSDQHAQPYVILDILYESGLLYISVQNIGNQPAHHVRVAFDRSIPGIDERPVNDLNLFQNLKFLPPGKALTTFLNRSDIYFQKEFPKQFEVTVEFQDEQKKKYQNKIQHDLSIYEDKHLVTDFKKWPTPHQGD